MSATTWRVVRHRQIEAPVAKRQERSVAESIGAVTVLPTRVAKESQRGVDAGYSMTSGVEVTGNAALATADLKGPSPRRRDELIEEMLPVVPVSVVLGGARPAHPVLGVGFPLPFGAHSPNVDRRAAEPAGWDAIDDVLAGALWPPRHVYASASGFP
jgi:hypothetical protein